MRETNLLKVLFPLGLFGRTRETNLFKALFPLGLFGRTTEL